MQDKGGLFQGAFSEPSISVPVGNALEVMTILPSALLLTSDDDADDADDADDDDDGNADAEEEDDEAYSAGLKLKKFSLP